LKVINLKSKKLLFPDTSEAGVKLNCYIFW